MDYSRKMFFVFYCVNIFLEIVVRNFIRMVLRSIESKDIIKNMCY